MIELNEEEIKKVKESLYNGYATRSVLQENIKHSTIGLEELLNSVKNIKNTLKYENSSLNWLNEVKQQFNQVAYLMKEFNSEFESVYDELSAKQIAETLAYEETNKFRVSINGDTIIGGNFAVNGHVTSIGHGLVSGVDKVKLNGLSNYSLKRNTNKGWNKIKNVDNSKVMI